MADESLVGIVEDSDVDYEVFHRVVAGSYDVCRWVSGEDALSEFSGNGRRLADLRILFVDCHLPGIDGIDLVRALRGIEGGEAAKIVVLSGSKAPGVDQRAIDAGADRFERKASSLTELRATLSRSFELLAA